jgi:hypothetical protein
MRHSTLSALLTTLLAGSAGAQPQPPGPPPSVPPTEALATIPELSPAQQVELRNILLERRNALEAARDKARAALEAQRRRDRDEIERIEEQSSARLRKALGDDGFRRYAEWRERSAPRAPGFAPRRDAPPRDHEHPRTQLPPPDSSRS